MTRKEALAIMNGEESSLGRMILTSIVDKIYDDIESRICENCGYVDGGVNLCNDIYTAKYCSNSNVGIGIVKDTFGCTEFQAKTEPEDTFRL